MSAESPGRQLLSLWRRLRGLPGGRWLFSRLLTLRVPYSGTIRPRVELLEPGHARIRMADRRAVRNHLRSVHALALANLGELTSGLATVVGLPPGVRSIVTELRTEYLKKARGPLVAEAVVELPETVEEQTETEVAAEIRDAGEDTVARVRVTWRLRPH